MNIKEKLAVQLYSVRKEMERDLEGTLQKIHEIGFITCNSMVCVAMILERYVVYYKNMS